MTEEESKLLSILESRVHQLMSLYNDTKIQKETLQLLCEKLEQENRLLKDKYDNLKIARIISVKKDDVKNTKNKLTLLVKEVDKCIALLNE